MELKLFPAKLSEQRWLRSFEKWPRKTGQGYKWGSSLIGACHPSNATGMTFAESAVRGEGGNEAEGHLPHNYSSASFKTLASLTPAF